MKKTNELRVMENLAFQEGFIDLTKFEKLKIIIDDWKFGVIYEVKSNNSEIKLNARISKNNINDYSSSELSYLIQDLNISSRISHPLILKSLGYSPVNFSKLPNPVIITEPIIGKLSSYLNNTLNPTNKLIIIYGIASSMSFLHSNNIIHRDLTPNNIFLDEFYHPKISNFGLSIDHADDEADQRLQFISELIGTPLYLSPEILQNKAYSKASDVYSFSLILYQIITDKQPFKKLKNLTNLYNFVVNNDGRPEIPEKVPQCYRSLIEKCWSKDPEKRPNLDQIVEDLEKNAEFITEGVDEEEFRNFIQMVKSYEIKYEENDRFNKLEDLIKENKKEEQNFIKFEANIQIDSNQIVNLNNFKKINEIGSGSKSRVFKIVENETMNFYAAKIFTDEIDKKSIDFLIKLSNEINIHSYLNHPSIVKFIGFNPKNFENEVYPVLITEFVQNGSLHDLIGSFFTPNEWNLTKISINIYGIALGMAYLHSHDILFKDLNPLNILEDENFYPKICDFGNSIFLSENKEENDPSMMNITYTAPEVLSSGEYSKKSDVYSFGMLIYSILSNEEPFKNLKNTEKIACITNFEHPDINENIPELYRRLITSCWDREPENRPTFDKIIEMLKESICEIDRININEFNDYVEYIDSITPTFHPKNPIIIIDENYNFDEFEEEDEDDENDLTNEQIIQNQKKYDKFESLKKGTCNLKDFTKKAKIGEGSFGATYKVIEKKTNFLYAAKISKTELNFDSPKSIININREVTIISKLNHPSIIKFIAYSPENFSNIKKPVIIFEFAPGGSLDDIIKNERKGISIEGWDYTKKLINIFGIASSMNYLHQQEIIHRDLKPENILLDKYLCPKLADLGLSKYIDDNQDENAIQSTDDVKGTPLYLSPEIWSKEEYSKASDVYAFALIIYEIITNQRIFQNINYYQLIKIVCTDKRRPEFSVAIPECYQSLIEECWSQDPDERPTFKEIVDLLKNDQDFITPLIDESEFVDYIDSIEQPNNSSEKRSFQKVVYRSKKKNKKTNFVHQDNFLDLSKYEIKGTINKGEFSKIMKAVDKETNVVYAAKISLIEIDDLTESEFVSLSREVNLLSQLNHPSILKFIGYSPINMKKEQKPVILTEYLSHGSLDDLFKMDEEEKKEIGWNKTKKLIIIYGIAHCMFYLHSKEILHRDLKPSNILLDDDLHPKLADFGLSVKQHRMYSMTFQSSVAISNKSTYSAPEILNCENFTKESDVYSFAIICYQIITEKVPFGNIKNDKQLLNEVYFNEKRPEFPDGIPSCYRELIESCWSQNPEDRLSFDQIVQILENMKDFIIDGVDENEFKNFVDSIKSYNSSFSPKARFLEPEDFEIMHNDSNENYVDDDDDEFSDIIYSIQSENENNSMKIIERSSGFESNREDDSKKVKINELGNSSSDIEIKSEKLKIDEVENEKESELQNENLDSHKEIENHDENVDSNKEIESDDENVDSNKEIENNDENTDSHKESESKDENVDSNKEIESDDENADSNKEIESDDENADSNKEIESNAENTDSNKEIEGNDENTDSNKEIENNDENTDSHKEIEGNDENADSNKEIENDDENYSIEKDRNEIIERNVEIFQEEETFDDNLNISENIQKNEDHDENIENYEQNEPINKAESDLMLKSSSEEIFIQNSYEKETNPTSSSNQNDNSNSSPQNNDPNQNQTSHEDEIKYDINYVQTCLIEGRTKELIQYLNEKCDNETTSSIFNKCFSEFPSIYNDLCNDGMALNNPVAYHKYALTLIFNKNSNEDDFKIARNHLQKSIQMGFTFSYFSLARLLHEYFKEDDLAFQVAKEGAEKGDRPSICLLGIFFARGIGTRKNREKGVPMMFQSGVKELYEQFATDIGLFYVEQKEIKLEENEEAFKWFEKAYLLNKTKATINNYALCFLNGIFVEKDIEKAKMILVDGAKRGDSNSLYILENIDPQQSIEYYQMDAQIDDKNS